MTGTVDIQELKKQALKRKEWRDAMLVDPSTILALIEIAEAAQKIAQVEGIPEGGCEHDLSLNCAETGAGIAFMSSDDFHRLRTALEGVKK